MSSIDQQPYTNELIIEYLLGALPEAESERLDELSFTDDEFAGQLQIVENDLVDAYVRGELSGKRLEQFNAIYFASPKRRDLVRFAKTLQSFSRQNSTLQAEDPQTITVAEQAPPMRASPGRGWWRFFTIPRLSLQWGLAAATALLVLVGGYLLVENARLRNQMNAAEAERATLQQREQELMTELASERQADDETASELERVRDRLAELEGQLSKPKDEKPEPAPQALAKVATFTLAPQLRGTGQISTATVPAGTAVVVLRLELETNDFPEYRATLKDPATGQLLWRSGRVKTSGKSSVIPVRLRADLLRSQNYTIDLSGISSNGTSDVVSSYTFKVEKP